MHRLDRRDWVFIAVCAAILAASLAFALANFSRAFPEASIDFRYDRTASRAVAEAFARKAGFDVAGLRNASTFEVDDSGKIFLERKLGLDRAQAVMKRDVRLWSWHQRWFRPLQEEEASVDVAPTGEIVAFRHKVPEDRPMPATGAADARATAAAFLARAGVDAAALNLVDESERQLPKRVQRIFTWESPRIRPAGAPYRYRVAVDGNTVTEYSQRLRVPDDWTRSYEELRSKNQLTGQIDLIFLAATMVLSLIVFIVRLRRRDVHIRFVLGVAITCVILVTGVSLNSFPSALAGYDTTTSYPAFLAQFLVQAILGSLGTAMLLLVICGSGEVLYRERLPQHLAIPRLWTPAALGSKRVFLSFVLGYALVAFFLAYQVAFYLIASRFGAWAPADVPYDDMLNSAFPWIAVLFAGFFPSLSEEFMSRAFSIPFFEKLLRSRVAAVIVAGFIWGFGHATYPNQPFYIRGFEVGLAGVVIGFLFLRFGLLPLLIWHYTVDAVYTSLLLFRSHNTYYVLSAAAAAFVFAIPMLISIVLYLRRGGFVPDDRLSNATLPVSAPQAVEVAAPAVDLPPTSSVRPVAIGICAAVLLAAAAFFALRPDTPSDAVDYRTSRSGAKAIAKQHLARAVPTAKYERVIATTVSGFRSWNRESTREDGGGPGDFDEAAAEHMLASGMSMRQLTDVLRTRVEAATWTVRFFTPGTKEEYFVEVDPRNARAIGFHKYQNEKAPGPRLDQAAALAIATRAFAAHGLDSSAFELKEALAFQQPARRDWLFHFQERNAMTDQAFRRVSIRVCGADVTQLATTVKVPDAVERAAATRTVRNIVMIILKIVAVLGALVIVVAGFVTAMNHRRPRWRVAVRWMLALAVIPLIDFASGFEPALFSYDTSIGWQTFVAGLGVAFFASFAVRLGVILLAVAVIDSAFPAALGAITREGRARLGRSAVVAALTAVGAFAAAGALLRIIAARFPATAKVTVNLPDLVAPPLPALIAIANALFAAVAVSGAVAAAAAGFRLLAKRAWMPDAVLVAIVFCVSLDARATVTQMPLMFLRAALIAAIAWIVVRKVLDGNLLAWPAAVFTASLAGDALSLAGNHRPDLQINAVVIAVVLVAMLAWLAARGSEPADA